MANSTISLTNAQHFSLGPVTAVDGAGQTVPLGGPLTFTSSAPTILLVTPTDQINANCTCPGPAGMATVTVTDTVATWTLDVTVTASAEVGLNVPVGTPA